MDFPNWFDMYARDFFTRHLPQYVGQADLRFLQLGAYTGDASVWLLENVLVGKRNTLFDVDTWRGSNEPEHEPMNWREVEAEYLRKTSKYRPRKLIRVKSTTAHAFSMFEPGFDFVYVDADHTARAVLNDAISAFRLLKPGGLLAFDDYQWKPYPDAPMHEAPAIAIDAFTACFFDQTEILEAGLQVWVRKL